MPSKLTADKPASWRDDEPLTLGDIIDITDAIRARKHDPEQARRLLALFVEQARNQPSGRGAAALLDYLCDAFASYLAKPRKGTLEAALGLTAPEHRPPSPRIAQKHDYIAWDLLQERLKNRSHVYALDHVAAKHSVSMSQADKVWAKRRDAAFDYECMSRRLAGRRPPLFTPSEMRILKAIYGEAIPDRQAIERRRT